MKVTIYTKDECTLCLEAERMLRSLQSRMTFELEIVDIEQDPEVYRLYRDRIPVVAVDGEEVAAAPLDEGQLRAALTL